MARLQSDMLAAAQELLGLEQIPTPSERVRRGSPEWNALQRHAMNEWRTEHRRKLDWKRNTNRIANVQGLRGQRLENGLTWWQVAELHDNEIEALKYWDNEREQEKRRNERAKSKFRSQGIERQ
ncbi:MAG: hypothetical protein ACRER3_01420 [Pseudomonas fluorescens]